MTWKEPPKIQVSCTRYAPANRRSLRPPRDENVSLTGTSASRSTMVSAVACVKSRLV